VSARGEKRTASGAVPRRLLQVGRWPASGVPEAANPHRPQGNGKRPRPPMLDAKSSAVLRDRLVGDIASIPSAEHGAEWPYKALPAKNTLTASDARLVQLAFELRLSALEGGLDAGQNGLASPLAGADEEGSQPSLPGVRLWLASLPARKRTPIVSPEGKLAAAISTRACSRSQRSAAPGTRRTSSSSRPNRAWSVDSCPATRTMSGSPRSER
jgi:hypothetical protein